MILKKFGKLSFMEKNLICFIVLLFLAFLIFNSYNPITQKIDGEACRFTATSDDQAPQNYLINTSTCRIVKTDPYHKEIIPYIAKFKYDPCSSLPFLAYAERTSHNNGTVIVRINETVIRQYSRLPVNCCIESVFRKGESQVRYSKCQNFESEIQVNHSIFRVVCTNFFKIVFKNTYAKLTNEDIEKIIRFKQIKKTKNKIFDEEDKEEKDVDESDKEDFNRKLKKNSQDEEIPDTGNNVEFNTKLNINNVTSDIEISDRTKKNLERSSRSDKKTEFNVILVGIDSISKQNLERTMPKSFEYLEKNYFSLNGYNKIEENTFPNLLAILTGRSLKNISETCNRDLHFDNCDFVWKDFKNSGYVTAYSEDELEISTFNYKKLGFKNPPTDVYYRPYFVASHGLPVKRKHGMATCTGPENSGERVFNTALDFVATFKNYPYFGLFWTNTFSHDSINFPSSMDEKVEEFLRNEEFGEATNDNTFVVFFSDHGFRFGEIRFTYTGWIEERLPYIYFKIPRNFQQIHPEMYRNFLANARNRLTTPYDFYMTLQHILKLSDTEYEIKLSTGCPKSQSLFEKMPENRTCEDACINQHWCTCHGHFYVDKSLEIVEKTALFAVSEINKLIGTYPEGVSECSKYTFNSITSAGMSKRHQKSHDTKEFLILFQTYPLAMYEATIRVTETKEKYLKFEILGAIERLNRYASNSFCVQDEILKKYCFCDQGWVTRLKNYLCEMFYC